MPVILSQNSFRVRRYSTDNFYAHLYLLALCRYCYSVFFDNRHYGVLRQRLEEQHNVHGEALHCQLFEAYMERLDFPSLHRRNVTEDRRIWTFEKTPNYMIWPHVPAAIAETCPWKPKIVIVLRNPIDRLYSHYQMNFVSQIGVPDLDTVLDRELVLLRKFGLSLAPNVSAWERQGGNSSSLFAPPPITTQERDSKDSIRFRGYGNHGFFPRYLLRGMYVYQLQRWQKHFDESHLLVLPYERLRNDMRHGWQQILDFVGAPQHELSEEELTTLYRPSFDLGNRNDMSPAEPLSNITREYLVDFFHPYNELLADLLGEDWRGIWDIKS